MAAFRAFAEFGSRGRRVERVATDAVENRFPPLELETPMVAPVIIKPQSEKHRTNEDAVDHDTCGEFEHRHNMIDRTEAAKRGPR